MTPEQMHERKKAAALALGKNPGAAAPTSRDVAVQLTNPPRTVVQEPQVSAHQVIHLQENMDRLHTRIEDGHRRIDDVLKTLGALNKKLEAAVQLVEVPHNKKGKHEG